MTDQIMTAFTFIAIAFGVIAAARVAVRLTLFARIFVTDLVGDYGA